MTIDEIIKEFEGKYDDNRCLVFRGTQFAHATRKDIEVDLRKYLEQYGKEEYQRGMKDTIEMAIISNQGMVVLSEFEEYIRSEAVRETREADVAAVKKLRYEYGKALDEVIAILKSHD